MSSPRPPSQVGQSRLSSQPKPYRAATTYSPGSHSRARIRTGGSLKGGDGRLLVRSTKPTLTTSSKGKSVRQTRLAEERRGTAAPPGSSSSSSASALDRFKFRGPKPTPFSATHSVKPSSEGAGSEARRSKKRKRPAKEAQDEDENEAQPYRQRSLPSSPNASALSQHAAMSPSHLEEARAQPFYFLPDLDEDGEPILSAGPHFSASSQTSQADAVKQQLSSPFRPASPAQHLSQSNKSNEASPSRSHISQSFSSPRYPQRPSQSSDKPSLSSQAKPSQAAVTDFPDPASSHPHDFLPSSIELPSQLAARLQAQRSSPVPHSVDAGEEPLLPDPPSSERQEHLATSPQDGGVEYEEHGLRGTPRHPLTNEQKHEVEELLEGLTEDGCEGAFEETYEETMFDRGKETNPAEGDLPEELVLSQSSSSSSTSSSTRPRNPFEDDIPLPPPCTRSFTLSPVPAITATAAGAFTTSVDPFAPHLAVVLTHADAATLTTARVNDSRPKALFGAAPRPFLCSPSYEESFASGSRLGSADLTGPVPLHPLLASADIAGEGTPRTDLRRKKKKPAMRLVPLTVEGVASHLRELVSYSDAFKAEEEGGAGGGGGGGRGGGVEDDPSYLRREVSRLTSELLSRDSALSTLHSSLTRITQERDAALEREKKWELKQAGWEIQREKARKREEVFGEVRRGLLGELQEERERRRGLEGEVRRLRRLKRANAEEEHEGEEDGWNNGEQSEQSEQAEQSQGGTKAVGTSGSSAEGLSD
ncbi:hypothetical protein JCM11641_002853 [Rhodosporidiobolus odoratus]